MNNNQGIIIDPTKSNKMIQSPQVSAPSTNDSSMSLGITKAVSNGIMDLGMAYQKLKDFQSKSYGLTTEASVDDDISNTMLEAQTNKDFYKTNDGINALETKVNEKLATYRKTSLEQGYDMEYVDAFEARIRHKLQMAKNNFLVKNYEYQEKVTLDNYIHSQEMAQQNNERYMALGDYSSALAGTHQVINNMISAGNAGIIDMAKVATGIKGVWKGNFNAFGLSLINKPNAQAELERYSKMTAGEFFEHFKGFNTKINGEDFMIGADEYEEFKSGLNRAQAEYNRRNKVEKEKTKIQEVNEIYDMKNSPVEASYKVLNLKAGDVVPPEASVIATNIANGTNFKTKKEIREAGYDIRCLPNDVEKYNKNFYADPNISLEAKFQNKLENLYSYAGAENKEDIEDFLDTDNKSLIPMGSMTFNVLQGSLSEDKDIANAGAILNKEMKELYSKPEKIAFFNIFENNKVNTQFENYDKKVNYSNVGSRRPSDNITLEVTPGAGMLYETLKYNAMYGDKKAKNGINDIDKNMKHRQLEYLQTKTGGILDPKVAKKLDIPEKAGLTFDNLSIDERQQLLDYYFENDPMFGSNEFKEVSRATFENVVKNGYGALYNEVDLGKHGKLILNKGTDTEKTRQSVLDFIEDSDNVFINSRTGQRIASFSNIKAISKIDEDEITLLHEGSVVINEKGFPFKIIPVKSEDKK